ncbi:MAG: hypothetical protein QCI38_05295, partial [Candidatus Thermoplasmatota archaeon]|nr:hypothetical protein [Candidatus Thermoplasmatota archaeon]
MLGELILRGPAGHQIYVNRTVILVECVNGPPAHQNRGWLHRVFSFFLEPEKYLPQLAEGINHQLLQ